jgi:thioredoxin-dependent peroxiredoxin
MVEEGGAAPDFTLASDSGEKSRCRPSAGSRSSSTSIPRTTRPAARRRACGIRDVWGDFERAGAVVLGVSPDSPKRHAKFREKYSLPFTLLADEEHEVAETYGTWVLKKYMGKEYMGVERSTFVIDEDGNLKKVMRSVKPDEHADDVLAALSE